MTREKLEGILADLQRRHFRSLVFSSRIACVRDELGKTLTGIVKGDGDERIVDFSEITPGLERYEDFQLEIWRRTVVSARDINGYLLILDAKDALARWSADTRQLAWSFFSKTRWCRGVIVVSSISPTRKDEFRRIGCLQDDGHFDRIEYFESALDDAEELWRLEVDAITS